MSYLPYAERTPEEVAQRLATWRLVDVREADEINGPLGHIDGVEHVPLATVQAEAAGWRRDEPLLIICRSGGRSGRACLALSQLGFRNVTNLTGGMLAWNEAGLPVVRDVAA